ncbi:hypothetical protein CsSME_00005256 [Camellia sinensis var. sinensis]
MITIGARVHAAARAYRLGSNSDFLLAANCHPAVEWAEEEPEVDPEELAKNCIRWTPRDVTPDLDNAITEMNGKAVQGPNGGPSFKLLVEVARPIGKSKKRARDDPQIKPASKISSHSKFSKDEQIFSTSGGLKSGAQEMKYSLEEPLVADPYEAAVVSLPVAVKERLLRILRLEMEVSTILKE